MMSDVIKKQKQKCVLSIAHILIYDKYFVFQINGDGGMQSFKDSEILGNQYESKMQHETSCRVRKHVRSFP